MKRGPSLLSLVAACSLPEPEPTTPEETDAPPRDTSQPEDTSPPVDTGASVDTGDTDILVDAVWRDVAAGSYTQALRPGWDCDVVMAQLVLDQAALDLFASKYAGPIDLTGSVDFLTEVAVTGWIGCGAYGMHIEIVDVETTGPTSFVVHYEIVWPYSVYGAHSTAYYVIAVSGTHWTSMTSTTTVVYADSGDSGY